MHHKQRTRNSKYIVAAKWLIYLVIVFLVYIYSTSIGYVLPKPLLLIPIAVCISMGESEMVGALVGLCCGYLLDLSMGKLSGFNAFILMVICMFTSILFLYLMRQNIINIVAITFAATLIQGGLDFWFYYAIWGYENASAIFTGYFLPSMIFTVISSPIVYIVIKFIATKVQPIHRQTIEEKNENISRE